MIAKRRSRRDPESGGQSVCHNTCLPICLPRETPIADLISSATTDRYPYFLATLVRPSILLTKPSIYHEQSRYGTHTPRTIYYYGPLWGSQGLAASASTFPS
jgi:hypothetical protein